MYSRRTFAFLTLVLLGSTSHSISQERRKIAWSKINPQLKSLATEEYSKRETNLFGPGFLEKASKQLAAEKILNKVSLQGREGAPPPKKAHYDNDKNDLRSILAKGASARYGSRRNQRQQPYSSYTRFQSPKYQQAPKPYRPATSCPKQKVTSDQLFTYPSLPYIAWYNFYIYSNFIRPSTSRPSSLVSPQLGTDNSRSMDSTMRTRMSPGAFIHNKRHVHHPWYL